MVCGSVPLDIGYLVCATPPTVLSIYFKPLQMWFLSEGVSYEFKFVAVHLFICQQFTINFVSLF